MRKFKNIFKMSWFSMKILFSCAPIHMFLYCLFAVITGFIPAVKLYLYRNLFNEAQIIILTRENGNVSLMILYASLYVLLGYFTNNAIATLMQYWKVIISDRFRVKINYKIYTKLCSVKFDYFLNQETFDVMNRIKGTCCDNIYNTSFRFISTIHHLVALSSAFIYMSTISWLFSAIGILLAIPNIWLLRKFNINKYYQSRRQIPAHRKAGYIYSLLVSRNALKEICIDESADFLISKWKKQTDDLFHESVALRRIHMYKCTYYDVFYAIIESCIILITSWEILRGVKMIGDITVVISGFRSLNNSTSTFGFSLSEFLINEMLYKEWNDFFAYEDEKRISNLNKDEVERNFNIYGLKLSGIKYKYPNGKGNVLNSLNLHIKPGEKIALVGENGCGKTTTVNILLGLLSQNKGEFQCGNIKSANLCRSLISCVFQNHINFNSTVKDCIIFGDGGNYDENRLRQVCEMLDILDFIDSLPKGFETNLGQVYENSTQLSEGQWQKLAFARALYKSSTQLLILDEPTAALDPKSEFDLYDNFLTLTKDKAVMLISHRLTFTLLMDRICYMEKGQIIENGSHEELMRLKGKYYNLYHKQIELFK